MDRKRDLLPRGDTGENEPARPARPRPPGSGPGGHGCGHSPALARTEAGPRTDGAKGDGIRTRLYRDGSLVKENFPVDEISDHLE